MIMEFKTKRSKKLNFRTKGRLNGYKKFSKTINEILALLDSID